MTSLRSDDRPAYVARVARAPFVGRGAVVETLLAERVVLLRAEAGAGKSRLLSEARTRSGDALAVTVRCHPGVVATYEPLEEAIAAAYRASADARRGAGVRSANDTERLLAIREAFERLASSRSLLVQIDDLHFAPEPTLDAIAFCIDRTRDSAIRWHLATRPAAPNARALDAMRRDDDCVAIDVPPLDERETSDLARSLGGTGLPETHRLTGGNPLYIEQWLAARTRPEAASTLRLTLEARLAALSPGEAEIAALLAVANRPVSRDDVAAALSRDAASLDADIRTLAASNILHADGGWLEFVHDLLRDARYDAIDGERRSGLHERLLSLAVGDEELARHLEGAGRTADAVEARLRGLRDALLTYSYVDARAAVERIARMRPLGASALWQLDATRIAATASTAGHPDDLTEWKNLIDAGSAVDPNTRAFFLERLIAAVGRSGPAERLCIDSVLNDPAVGDDARAQMLSWQARVHYGELKETAALETVERALALVKPRTDIAYQLGALRAMIRGAFDREGARAEFAALTDDAANRTLPSYPFAFLCAATHEDRYDDHEGVYAAARAGIDAGGRSSSLYYYMAVALRNLGRTDEAVDAYLAGSASATARGVVPSGSLVSAQIETLAWRGDLERARELIDVTKRTGLSASDRSRFDGAVGFWLEALGEIERAILSYESASRNLERTTDSSESSACASLARIFALRGDLARAEREVRRLRDAAGRGSFAGLGLLHGELWLALGSIGDERGAAAARAALARVTEAHMPQLPRAVALAELGERTRDRGAMLEAIAIFDAAGAGAFAERARVAARSLGFRPGAKTAVRETLTERETEVVSAIGAGKTNREIAASLHISPKTVAAAVSSVLLKCGLRSRVDIAAQVASGKPFVRL